MTRYFIDSSDGDQAFLDSEGIDLADDYVARYAALDALPDMARDAIPDGDERRFSVSVRNAAGKIIYQATLTLAGRWEQPRDAVKPPVAGEPRMPDGDRDSPARP